MLGLALLSTPVGVGRAQGTTPTPAPAAAASFPLVSASEAWLAHYEHWIESRLIRPELVAAAGETEVVDASALTETLEQVELDVLRAAREPVRLPDQAFPRLLARGLSGRPLEAARLFARGESDAALELLDEPDTRELPNAKHLRAQLLDRLTADADAHPVYRFASLREYRAALREAPDQPAADRAKLRIGQIYLELGWLAEARAELGVHIGSIGEPYATQARLSLAETCYAARDFACAIATLESLEPERLAAETAQWALQRRADSHFRRAEIATALAAYEQLAADPEAPLPARARLRFGTALLLAGRAPEARQELAALADAAPDPETAALAGVVLARTLRTLGDYGAAEKLARESARIDASRDAAALAILESLEARRPRDERRSTLPPQARDVVLPWPDSDATALLYFRIAAGAEPDEPLHARARYIGRAVALAPTGRVRALARRFLASELSLHLADATLNQAPAHPKVVDLMERYLDPAQLDASSLLLGVDELYRAGHYGACGRWARTLVRAERRPLRQGLASWREIGCTNLLASDRNAANRVLVRADSVNVGPFALALAVRAAEQQVRAGDLRRAVRTYTRALSALAEPGLVPPALLRLGELEVEAGRDRSALRSLQRGLALTEEDALRGDPFRKSALLALARLSARGTGRELFESTLAAERPHVDEGWQRIFDYLRERGRSSGEGPDLYARALREYQALKALRRRVQVRADRYGGRS